MSDHMKREFYDIDADKLDQQVAEQPGSYFELAKRAADAQYQATMADVNVDVAKEEIKKVDAVLDTEVRRNPAAFGLLKATDESTKAAVQAHSAHEAAFKRWVEARRDLAEKEHHRDVLLKAAVAAMDNRKVCLGKAVELHLANVRSTPRFNSELSRERERFTQDAMRRPPG